MPSLASHLQALNWASSGMLPQKQYRGRYRITRTCSPVGWLLSWLRSGEGRLRRDREVVVVGDAVTADHDRTKPTGGVVAATGDAGEETAGSISNSATDACRNAAGITGTTITGLYVAAHGTNQSWGQNCLSAPLYPGQTTHISWPTESGIPNWDIRITYSSGVEAQFNSAVNLTQYARLVVSLLEDGTVSHLDEYEA